MSVKYRITVAELVPGTPPETADTWVEIYQVRADDLSLPALSALLYPPKKREHKRKGLKGAGLAVKA